MSKPTRSKTLSVSEDGYRTDDTESVPIFSLVKSTCSKVKIEKRIDDKDDKESKLYTTRSAASSKRSNITPVEKFITTKYARSSKRIPQNSYDNPIPHASQDDDYMGLSLGSLVKIPFKKSLKVDTKKAPKNDILSVF